jgi:hypothetical protein
MGDERIVRDKKAAPAPAAGGLEAGPVLVDGELFQFTRMNIWEDKLSILLPDEFFEMPFALAAVKYPMETRPQLILTNPNTTVNVTFGAADEPITPGELDSWLAEINQIIHRSRPDAQLGEIRTAASGAGRVVWFDSRMGALDEPIYTIHGLMELEGIALYVSFSCPVRVADSWSPLAEAMLKSIELNV